MRKGRGLTLLVLALALGGAAAWVANNWLLERMMPNAEAGIATTPAVVAALAIPFGQKIDPAHVKIVNMPDQYLPPGSFNDIALVEGQIATQAIVPGEVIVEQRIAEHIGGSALAAVVNKSMRAVTVRVNDVIGVAGFLLPGNRVDVLSSRMVNRRAVTKTLLQDVKVLAVDQTVASDKNDAVVVRAVTLEVSPKESELLFGAREEGTLQLTLRNPLDTEVVAAAEVPVPEVKTVKKVAAVRAPRRAPSITIIRGTDVRSTRSHL